jgi:hypothetical protein
MEALKTSGMTLYNIRHNNKKHEKCRKMPPMQASKVCTKHSKRLRTILNFLMVVQNNSMHNTNNIYVFKTSAQGSLVGISVVLATVEPHNRTIF